MAIWDGAYGAYGTRLYVEATELSQNQDNNTSEVRVRVYMAGQYEYNNFPSTLTVTLNSTQIIYETGFTYDFSGSVKSKEWATVDITVPHNPDGTGLAYISAYATDGYAADPAEVTVTGTLTLTTLTTDKPLELSSTNFQLGETITIYPNLIDGQDMDLFLKIGSPTKTISIQEYATGTFNWTVPMDLSEYFGSNQTISAVIEGEIYSSGGYVDKETVNVQINLPADFGREPEVGAVVLTELNNDIVNGIGETWVARRSRIQFTADITTQMGATIQEATLHLKLGTQSPTTYAMSVSAQQVSVSRENLSAGSYQAWVTAKDNRGYVGQSAVVTFSVVAYEPPKINSVSASRDPNDNTKINIIANVSNHHLSNRNSLFVRLLLQQGGEWLQIGETQTTNSGAIEYNHTATDADELFSFNFRIEVNDLLTAPVVSEFNVGSGTAYPPINTFEDRALAAGVIYDEDLGGNIQTSSDGMAIGRTRIIRTGTTLTNLEMEDNDIKYNGTSLLSGGSTISGDVLQVVNHGANGSISRPEGAVAVYWIGSVEPLNATDNDIWVR